MSLMTMLLVAWGVMTGVLILLLIYRSTLTMHEDDQLFLGESESHMQAEQTELIARMNKLTTLVRLFGALSVLLIVTIAGYALWERMNEF
jgi:Tfp pilus assembly protein PilN